MVRQRYKGGRATQLQQRGIRGVLPAMQANEEQESVAASTQWQGEGNLD